MKKSLLVLALMALAPVCALAWLPFVEQGKVWRYKLECGTLWPEQLYDIFVFDLKIDGTEEIDGVEYATCYAYLDGEVYPDSSTPICYLREDKEWGTVYYRENTSLCFDNSFPWYILESEGFPFYQFGGIESGVLVSITDPLASDTFMYWRINPNFLDGFTITKYSYTSPNDYVLNGWHCAIPEDRDQILLEGVGYVEPYSTFLGPIAFVSNGTMAAPMLYTVTDGKGNIIYCNEDNNPSLDSQIGIALDGDESETLYNIKGVAADSSDHGVLIKRTGTTVTKQLR